MPEPDIQVIEQKPAEPKIVMGKTLSEQSAQLTKLLQDRPDKKAEEKPLETPAPVEQPKEEPKTPAPATNEPETQPERPAVELPSLNKYILDKLPTLQTRIKDGEQVKVVQFKDVTDLPAGFELASDADRAQFTVDVSAQVGRAKDAAAEYRQAENNENLRKWEVEEAKDVAGGLKRLQQRGILDEFQYEESDARFNDDPAVKTANEIYSLMKQTNKAHMEAGRTYRIGLEDAADKYFASKAREEKASEADESQKAKEQPKEEKPKKELTDAQKERQEIARQSKAPSGGEAKAERPIARSGMTMNDIRRLAAMGKI
jgi:hypothetical protein